MKNAVVSGLTICQYPVADFEVTDLLGHGFMDQRLVRDFECDLHAVRQGDRQWCQSHDLARHLREVCRRAAGSGAWPTGHAAGAGAVSVGATHRGIEIVAGGDLGRRDTRRNPMNLHRVADFQVTH